jgi:hypothetical protein
MYFHQAALDTGVGLCNFSVVGSNQSAVPALIQPRVPAPIAILQQILISSEPLKMWMVQDWQMTFTASFDAHVKLDETSRCNTWGWP